MSEKSDIKAAEIRNEKAKSKSKKYCLDVCHEPRKKELEKIIRRK
jgi:hypothetical protein